MSGFRVNMTAARDIERKGGETMAHDPEVLRDRGKSLEDEFFHRENKKLMARLAEMRAKEVSREGLGKATGITSAAVLDKLMELGIRPETVAALAIVPLAEVAWADGSLDARERKAILDRASESGISAGSAEHALLEEWLARRPEEKLFTAWTHMVKGLTAELGPEAAARLKTSLLERAQAVATASGGVLGMGSKVSSAEAAMLAKLEAAFAS